MDSKLQSILEQLREYLQSLYGDNLDRIILYGSQARGTARPDSDIDILIVLKELESAWREIDRTSEFIAELCLENNLVISRNFVDLDRFQMENSPFFLNVRREGIAV